MHQLFRSASKLHVGDRIFARKTSSATLKPVKTIRFSDRTCKRHLSEIRFCRFTTHLLSAVDRLVSPIVLTQGLNQVCELLPKNLKLMPTLRASLLKNLNRRDSQNPSHPCDDGGERQLGLHILASTSRTLRFYSWILNNHGSASLDE